MNSSYAVASSVGRVRKENQDNYYLNGTMKAQNAAYGSVDGSSENMFQTYAVCDGMGGEAAGEVAAYLAVSTLGEYTDVELWTCWYDYVYKANRKICDFAEQECVRSGTTLASLLFRGNQFCAMNVGDSRTYRITNGQIQQLSKDHTEFQMLVDCGKLEKTDFANTNTHNHLTQHLGIDPEELVVEPYVKTGVMDQPGDYFLICSDGLYGSVEEEQILSILQGDADLLDKCSQLVDLAEEQGSRDNVTAMLIYCDELESAEYADDLDSTMEGMEQTTVQDKCTEVAGGTVYDKDEKVVIKAETEYGKKKEFGFLGGLLIALICLGLIGRIVYNQKRPVVDGVIGHSVVQATEILEEKGFQVKVVKESSDNVPLDCVISQSVEKGTRSSKNSVITLTVSSGRESVELPDVRGKSEKEAKEMLESLELKVTIEYNSKEGTTGQVLEQSPSAGMPIVPGEGVVLTVSGEDEAD